MSVTLNTQLEDLMFSSQIPHLDLTTSDDRQRGRHVDRLGWNLDLLGTHIPYGFLPQHLVDELCMFDNVPENITRFSSLRLSSFATWHSPNWFGTALAAQSGDFQVFARELFMYDYDMGDGGHVFRTS